MTLIIYMILSLTNEAVLSNLELSDTKLKGSIWVLNYSVIKQLLFLIKMSEEVIKHYIFCAFRFLSTNS